MRIAISGLHGQGKTTLINALKNTNLFSNFSFVDSPTRPISKNFKINETGNQDTQMAIMMQHYFNQLSDNIILDRCALDGLAYSKYFASEMHITIVDAIYNLYRYLIPKYDIIFYIEHELPLTSDGTRSINVSFFEEIKTNFEHLIKSDNLNVVRLAGSVEQRVAQFITEFNNFKK